MATESEVDPTFPADNVKVDKAEMRAQFATIQEEITDLMRTTRLPYQIAFGLVSL